MSIISHGFKNFGIAPLRGADFSKYIDDDDTIQSRFNRNTLKFKFNEFENVLRLSINSNNFI